MITFRCSSCHEPIQTANELVGKAILCPHCGIATTVASAAITTPGALPTYPSSIGVMTADAVEAAEQARRRREADERDSPMLDVRNSGGWLPSLINILVIIAILAVPVAMIIPAISKVRGAAARTQSTNNLKNLSLTIHSFHDTHKHLPFNGSDIAVDKEVYSVEALAGNHRSGSWGFQILPFIEIGAKFAPPGVALDAVIPLENRLCTMQVFICPIRGRPPFDVQNGTWTDYFYNNYLNDPKQASRPNCASVRRTLLGIIDDTSTTILIGQGNIATQHYAVDTNVTLSTSIFRGGTNGTLRAGDDGDKAPTGVTLQRDSADLPTFRSWGGPSEHGALFAMADGTVRVFPYNTQNFSSFLTPTGGEAVVMPD